MRRAAEGKLGVLDSFDVMVVAYVWLLGIERALETGFGVHAECDVGRKVLQVQTDAQLDEVTLAMLYPSKLPMNPGAVYYIRDTREPENICIRDEPQDTNDTKRWVGA